MSDEDDFGLSFEALEQDQNFHDQVDLCLDHLGPVSYHIADTGLCLTTEHNIHPSAYTQAVTQMFGAILAGQTVVMNPAQDQEEVDAAILEQIRLVLTTIRKKQKGSSHEKG